MVVGSSPIAATSDIVPVLSKEFLDIQANTECGITLKRVRDMIRTYSQLNIFTCFVRLQTNGINEKDEVAKNGDIVIESSPSESLLFVY